MWKRLQGRGCVVIFEFREAHGPVVAADRHTSYWKPARPSSLPPSARQDRSPSRRGVWASVTPQIPTLNPVRYHQRRRHQCGSGHSPTENLARREKEGETRLVTLLQPLGAEGWNEQWPRSQKSWIPVQALPLQGRWPRAYSHPLFACGFLQRSRFILRG